MAGPITEALSWAVEKITAQGVRAVTIAQNLNLPAVWVTIDRVEFRTLDKTSADVTLTILAVTPGRAARGDLEQLDTLVAAASRALSVSDWDADSVTLPNQSPDPLLAMRTTHTIRWENHQ